MTFSDLADRILGGPIPYVPRPEREVHVMDGTTYTVELVWFRRGFKASYHTPRLPRSVRRIRAAERARDQETARRGLAGEPTVQVGDVLSPHHNYIPVQVTRCRDAQHDEWRRAREDEQYSSLDDSLPVEHRQVYDWVHPYVGPDGVEHIAGWSTEAGVLQHHPVLVLEIRDDVPA